MYDNYITTILRNRPYDMEDIFYAKWFSATKKGIVPIMLLSKLVVLVPSSPLSSCHLPPPSLISTIAISRYRVLMGFFGGFRPLPHHTCQKWFSFEETVEIVVFCTFNPCYYLFTDFLYNVLLRLLPEILNPLSQAVCQNTRRLSAYNHSTDQLHMKTTRELVRRENRPEVADVVHGVDLSIAMQSSLGLILSLSSFLLPLAVIIAPFTLLHHYTHNQFSAWEIQERPESSFFEVTRSPYII
jgi:hypothetical protein